VPVGLLPIALAPWAMVHAVRVHAGAAAAWVSLGTRAPASVRAKVPAGVWGLRIGGVRECSLRFVFFWGHVLLPDYQGERFPGAALHQKARGSCPIVGGVRRSFPRSELERLPRLRQEDQQVWWESVHQPLYAGLSACVSFSRGYRPEQEEKPVFQQAVAFRAVPTFLQVF